MATGLDYYNNALNLSQQRYGQIMQGYQSVIANQNAAYNRTSQDYTNLGNAVQQTIQGVGQSESQAIRDQYQAQLGSTTQSLASRGLGNTTVVDSAQRGLLSEKQKNDIELSGKIANLRAGYQSDIGKAQLAFVSHGYDAENALAQNHLNYMAHNQQLEAGLGGQAGSMAYQYDSLAAQLKQQKQLADQQAALTAQGQAMNYALGMGGLQQRYAAMNQDVAGFAGMPPPGGGMGGGGGAGGGEIPGWGMPWGGGGWNQGNGGGGEFGQQGFGAFPWGGGAWNQGGEGAALAQRFMGPWGGAPGW